MEDNPKVDYKKMNRFFELCLDEFDILIVLNHGIRKDGYYGKLIKIKPGLKPKVYT
jgi:hypothetical protein